MNSAAANQKKITNPVRSMYDVLICIAFIYLPLVDYKQWSISYRPMDPLDGNPGEVKFPSGLSPKSCGMVRYQPRGTVR